MNLPDDLEYDQQEDKSAVDWQVEAQNEYVRGAITVCRAIIAAIDTGGDLIDVKRVVQGVIQQLEVSDANVQR